MFVPVQHQGTMTASYVNNNTGTETNPNRMCANDVTIQRTIKKNGKSWKKNYKRIKQNYMKGIINGTKN